MKASITLEGGTSIEYLEAGQGEPLVYFHGGGGVFGNGRFFVELAETYRVLMPSRPGYDGSNGICESARDEAEAMAAFLRQVCSEPVNLIAESAGGASGCWLSILYPQLVKSLVLVAPAAFASHARPRPQPEEMERILFGDHPAWTAPLGPEEMAQRQRNAAVSAARVRPADGNQALLERLGEIRLPTLILWGTADRQLPPDNGLIYKQRIPDSYRVYIYGAAHVLPIAACAQFVRITRDFLTRGDAFVVNSGD
jgi:pimeloyl-ACP methyl ester carboxylesterase